MSSSALTLTLIHLKLYPSGGWLGELTIFIAEQIGAWDVLVLLAISALALALMRAMYDETAMTLGLVFDLAIPLQYHSKNICEFIDWSDHIIR